MVVILMLVSDASVKTAVVFDDVIASVEVNSFS